MNMRPEETDTPYTGLTFEQWLKEVVGENADAIQRFLGADDHHERVMNAPGSRGAHHAWQGGYKEHLRQTFMIAAHTYNLMYSTGRLEELPSHEKFTLSDALTVLFLHDIEKPFVYRIDNTSNVATDKPMDKSARRQFRASVIDSYGFQLTPTMANALQFVEGERDADHIPGGRAESPLASLCQVADNLSARGFYNHGRATPN